MVGSEAQVLFFFLFFFPLEKESFSLRKWASIKIPICKKKKRLKIRKRDGNIMEMVHDSKLR